MPSFDLSSAVRVSVHRAVANVNYSGLLEEVTRHERETCRAPPDQRPRDSSEDRRLSHLLFTDAQMQTASSRSHRARAVLIGASSFMSKIFADEFRKHNVDVTVVARRPSEAEEVYGPIFDGSAERKHKERQGYVVRDPVKSDAASAPFSGTKRSLRAGDTAKADLATRAPSGKCSTLRIVAGDLEGSEDAVDEALRSAIHGSDVVIFLASARNDPLLSWNRLWSVDVAGLKATARAAAAEDAHLVVLSPLFAWSTRWRPMYLVHNYVASKRGYLRASRCRERLLLDDDGRLSSFVQELAPSLRFTIFRTNPLVFPAVHPTVLLAKNNQVDDQKTLVDITRLGGKGFLGGGDVNARLFASIVIHCVCLHRAALGSRIDVVGASSTRSGGISVLSVNDLDASLSALRHEPND